VSVAKGEGPTIFHSFGRIDFDPRTQAAGPDSLWRVYSMTKPLTGIAAMILIEQGKLKLDQPISDFIPTFKSMCVLDNPAKGLACHPAQHAITVRNLLTHTAGLGYDIITRGPLLDEYKRNGMTAAAFDAPLETRLHGVRPPTLAAFADRLAHMPLVAEPGTKWSYSFAIDVLGRVIEVASGMPFDRFLQTRIFTPLKMNSTWFTVPKAQARRLSTNYVFIGDIPLPLDLGENSIWLSPPTFPYGGSGLVSSARDYDRFLHMLQNGGTLDGARILKPETVRLAMSNLLPEGADTTMLNAMAEVRVPLGFGAAGMVYLADDPNGPGKGTYGWAGAAGTYGWVDPEHQVRGVMMVNYLGRVMPLRSDVTRAVYSEPAH